MGKKINPLISLAVNLLFAGKEQSNPVNTIPEIGEIQPILRLRQKEGAVLLLLGRRESGKTTLAYRLAQVIGRPTYAVSPEEKPPQWVKEMKLEELDILPPPFSTLVLDDVPVYASSRDYQSELVRNIERIIPVCRHTRKLILIFCSQSSSLSDRYILDADIIMFKQLSLLVQDLERPAVNKLYKNVEPVFSQMSETQIKKHCYVFCHSWQGLAKVNRYE